MCATESRRYETCHSVILLLPSQVRDEVAEDAEGEDHLCALSYGICAGPYVVYFLSYTFHFTDLHHLAPLHHASALQCTGECTLEVTTMNLQKWTDWIIRHSSFLNPLIASSSWSSSVVFPEKLGAVATRFHHNLTSLLPLFPKKEADWLRQTENTFNWRMARRMSKIWKLKSERCGCLEVALLNELKTLSEWSSRQ